MANHITLYGKMSSNSINHDLEKVAPHPRVVLGTTLRLKIELHAGVTGPVQTLDSFRKGRASTPPLARGCLVIGS
jgi:hypothetical protein